MPENSLYVAYILKRFPRFSETFILNEVLALERQGVKVEIFSLMRPPEETRHSYLKQLKADVTYLPDVRDYRKLNLAVGGIHDMTSVVPLYLAQNRDLATLPTLLAGKTEEEAGHLMVQAAVLALLVGARRIDHLHAHFGSNAASVALMAGRIMNFPVSFTAHARDIYHTYQDPEIDDMVRACKIRMASFVVTVSDYNRKHMAGLVEPAGARSIRRLYNGIDLNRFDSVVTKQPGNCYQFIAVGRLIEKKGFRFLIDACRILRERGAGFRCVIVGDGPDRELLQQQILDNVLQDSVHLVSAQPQEKLIESLGASDTMVLPCVVARSGDRDGLPTVLLEAMAMRLPLISTDVAGVPEIIQQEVTGYVVPPGNAGLLAASMLLNIKYPEKAREMGLAGRERANSLFNLQTNTRKLHSWFDQSRIGNEERLNERGAF